MYFVQVAIIFSWQTTEDNNIGHPPSNWIKSGAKCCLKICLCHIVLLIFSTYLPLSGLSGPQIFSVEFGSSFKIVNVQNCNPILI